MGRLLCLSLLLGGCVVVHSHPAQTGVGGPVPTGAPLFTVENGAGVTIQPGVRAGYGITSNTGSSFRIVWTGDAGASGTLREFWGSAWTTGSFDSLVPGCTGGACPLEADDFVSGVIPLSTGGERIDWDTFATDGLDGFDCTATAEPVYFDMYIDGEHLPGLVVFTDADTGVQSSPSALPFGLTTR